MGSPFVGRGAVRARGVARAAARSRPTGLRESSRSKCGGTPTGGSSAAAWRSPAASAAPAESQSYSRCIEAIHLCRQHPPGLVRSRPVAKSLIQARREASERTAQSIARLERDGLFNDSDDRQQTRLVPRRELRGWPCAGKGIGGAINGSTWQRRTPTQPGMSSSRLAVDAQGRTVVVVATPSLCLQVGERFVVLDWFDLGFTRPGRAPTARERMAAPEPMLARSGQLLTSGRTTPVTPRELVGRGCARRRSSWFVAAASPLLVGSAR